MSEIRSRQIASSLNSRLSAAERVARLPLSKKILFTVVINLAILTALEVGIRIAGYFMYNRSPYFLFYGIPRFMADDDPEGHTDARDGYFKFPANRTLNQYGMFSDPTPIRINGHGFRGADIGPQKADNVFRVVCLGASSTFGFFSRDDFTYPAVLEGMFAQSDTSRPTVEVINAGIPHAKMRNIAAMFRGEITGYDPDLITVYAGYNDAVHIIDANWLQKTMRWLHTHSASYVALKNVITAVGGPELHSRWAVHVSGAKREYVLSQIELHVAEYRKHILDIIGHARASGIRTLLIKQAIQPPTRADSGKREVGYWARVTAARTRLANGQRLTAEETVQVIHAALMTQLDSLATEWRIPVVDNIEIVDQAPKFFASYVHLTEDGNRALARVLHEAITNQILSGIPAEVPAPPTHNPG